MALLFDRVLESSTSTGTGDISLTGAHAGYQAFGDVLSVDDACPYCIQAVDANGNPSGDWEVGTGTYSAADTLTRTTVEASSNSGSAVDFAAGTKWVFLDAGAKTLRRQTVQILVTDPNGSAITTGDGKAYFRVPSTINGLNLVAVAASLSTASSSGTPAIQIRNATQTADMLTTKLTIDESELDSSGATAAVIDAANDDVATGDQLYIDIDVAGTGAKGLVVEMQFA
jgi:hypothetical protein